MSTERHRSIHDRADLVDHLEMASELEHGLSLQYLFTAYTLKDNSDPGDMTSDQLNAVMRWKSDLFQLAAQEMQHLVQASNLLAAVGGRAHLSRPNFPQAPRWYAIELPWGLWRFTDETLAMYQAWEQLDPTAEHDKVRVALYATDLPEYVKDAARSWGGVPSEPRVRIEPESSKRRASRALPHQTLGQLYEEIARAFRDMPAAALFVGDPARQVTAAECDFPQVRPTLTQDDALAAIRLLVEQSGGDDGDGRAAVASRDSHDGIFARVRSELSSMRAQMDREGRVIDPSRRVAANPRSRVEGQPTFPRCNYIEDPFTRRVNDLHNDAYVTMLMMLRAFFATPTHPGARRIHATAFLRVMMGILKPLGEQLTKLPLGRDGWCAGPSFEIDGIPGIGTEEGGGADAAAVVDRLADHARAAQELVREAKGAQAQRAFGSVAATLSQIRVPLVERASKGT